MKKNKKYSIWIGIAALLIVGYLVADMILFNGIKPKIIEVDGFQANYYSKKDIKESTVIVLIGGGQWGDHWGSEFAKLGYVGLSLHYIGRKGLPKLPEEINLEYFEKALNWLNKQPEVDPNKIIVMGASRNAELSLVLASIFPNQISGVIAYAPSSVSWSNTVLPYNSNELKPSWKFKGIDIPFIPMEKISGNESNKIDYLQYWENGLDKTKFLEKATIKVERINGPILLLSGKNDKVWPSTLMADMIERRLKKHEFNHSFQNIKYKDAGHLISSNPDSNSDLREGEIYINGTNHQFEYGGTNEGDYKAKQDAKMKVLAFIEKLQHQ